MLLFEFGDDVDGAELKAFLGAWAWFSDEFGCEACSGASDAVSTVFGLVTGELTEVETGVEVGVEFLADTEVEFWVTTEIEAP